MNIYEALQSSNMRVSKGDAWLYWDEFSNEWVVVARPAYARRNKTLYRGHSPDDAVTVLAEYGEVTG